MDNRSNYLYFSLAFALTSCAGHQYKKPESIQSKMSRFEARSTNINPVPKLEILADPIDYNSSSSRDPASVAGQIPALPKSNKKTYFLTLFGQYNSLKGLYTKEQYPEIKHCPNFHTSLVDHRDFLQTDATSKMRKFSYSNLSPKDLALYPELNLPASSEGATPRVYDILNNERLTKSLGGQESVVNKAIGIHLTRLHSELNELCEVGYSDNYYTYENLSSHINTQGKKFRASKENMKTLMKTTVFSNWVLIDALQDKRSNGRIPASRSLKNEHHSYSEAIAKKLNVDWASSYVGKLKRLRQ